LNFVVLDEFQDMKPDTWYKVLRPTLSSTRGGALIIGTPKGFSEFHKLWQIGQNETMQARGQWKSWQFVTADSPFVPESEVEAAKNDMDPKSFAQEYLRRSRICPVVFIIRLTVISTLSRWRSTVVFQSG
jgi:hypothetical protein